MGSFSHSDNRYSIISGFSSHLPIILDIVLILRVGIAMTTVALWGNEDCAVSVSFFIRARSLLILLVAAKIVVYSEIYFISNTLFRGVYIVP